MAKKTFKKIDVKERILKYRVFYESFFYDKWMSSREVKGDITREEAYYIMKKFWSEGTICTWMIKHLDILGFAPYAVFKYNMYDFPIEIQPVNVRGVSPMLIPNKIMGVNKDIVIGWANKSHKPIIFFMKKFIDRLVQIEILMDNNLGLQNIPFLLTTNGTNEDKINYIINKILAGDIVINVDGEVMDDINLLQTAISYNADKFQELKKDVMNEALTYLGINNNPDTKKERQIVDEVNANNQEIAQADDAIGDEINDFTKLIKEVFGKTIQFVSKYDIINMGSEEKPDKEDDVDA